ncbi:MAG: hypothetical protein U1C18_00020, partial [Patescibacteria group bacterium]|nr:hypothetical protein [Patescibacteria group bacterium]
LGKHPEGHQYDYPTEWHCRLNGYKGQTQSIYYLRYTGGDSRLHLDLHEASDYAWVAPEKTQEKVFYRRKKIASMIVEKYKDYA